MKKTTKVTKTTKAKKVAIGAGLTVFGAAAIAGAYFLYGSKDAAANRKRIKAWSVKAKGEVLQHLEDLKNVDRKTYDAVIDEVSKKYKKLENLSVAEIAEFVTELKAHWKDIAKGMAA